MKKLLQYTFAIFILSLNIYSQQYSDSITKNWKLFTLKHSEEAIVLDYIPNSALCGTLAFASITIVKTTKGETFRALDLCNSEKYAINETINVIPEKAPSFNVIFPSKHIIVSENKKEIVQDINYDETILKTTWARIERRKK
ncbi:hypothetical protein [Flavobacterium sp.]|uniref:hypothetical protein n=1 Tax=Flavobacterium sp. TaxID=239 RepID=UPI0031D7FA44